MPNDVYLSPARVAMGMLLATIFSVIMISGEVHKVCPAQSTWVQCIRILG